MVVARGGHLGEAYGEEVTAVSGVGEDGEGVGVRDGGGDGGEVVGVEGAGGRAGGAVGGGVSGAACARLPVKNAEGEVEGGGDGGEARGGGGAAGDADAISARFGAAGCTEAGGCKALGRMVP